jgi:hypothetical protein
MWMVVLTLAVGSTRYPHTRKDHGELTYDKQLTALLVIDRRVSRFGNRRRQFFHSQGAIRGPSRGRNVRSEATLIILIIIGKMPSFPGPRLHLRKQSCKLSPVIRDAVTS